MSDDLCFPPVDPYEDTLVVVTHDNSHGQWLLSWDLGHFPAEPIPSAADRKTAQEYAAALNGDDDPVQDTDRPGIANAAMHKAMTTPKPTKPATRDEPGLLVVAPMGSHARGWGL